MRPLVEIEYSFFGCLFDNPKERVLEAFNEGAKLEWFTERRCRVMWAAVESLWHGSSFENVDALLIVQEAKRLASLPKGDFEGTSINSDFYDEAINYRRSAVDTERSDIHGYSAILREGSIERRIKEAMKDSTEDFSTEKSSEKVGSSLATNIAKIIEDESPVKEISVDELSDSVIADYYTAHEEFTVKKNYDYVVGIPMPWPESSRILNGLQVGLHIVAGRPSAGKTSYVLQCINYWCSRGYRVVFNCLDMAAKQILKRPLSTISGVAIDRCEEGHATEEELQRVVEANNQLKKWAKEGLFTVKCEYDVNAFKTWCTIRHSAHKLDIAVIDYAQQLQIRGSGHQSENERLTNVSATLKSIAVELGMPVVALSQLSRDNVKDKNGSRPPTIADLRGSGALEQDAFSVTLIYKDETIMEHWKTALPTQFIPPSGDPDLDRDNLEAMGAVWVDYAKNQNGRTGKVPFVVFQNHYRWFVGDRYAPKPDSPALGPAMLPKFQKLTVDWRFSQEPLLSIAKSGGHWTLEEDPLRGRQRKVHPYIVYPDYWELKAKKICEDFGWEIPDYIKSGADRIENSSYHQADLSDDKPTQTTQNAAPSNPMNADYVNCQDETPTQKAVQTTIATQQEKKVEEKQNETARFDQYDVNEEDEAEQQELMDEHEAETSGDSTTSTPPPSSDDEDDENDDEEDPGDDSSGYYTQFGGGESIETLLSKEPDIDADIPF